jgi:hypothetical protein
MSVVSRREVEKAHAENSLFLVLELSEGGPGKEEIGYVDREMLSSRM